MRLEPVGEVEFPASITHTFVNGNLVLWKWHVWMNLKKDKD